MEAVATKILSVRLLRAPPSDRFNWNLTVASPGSSNTAVTVGGDMHMLPNGSSSCLQGPHLPSRLLRSGRPAVARKGLCRSGVASPAASEPSIRYDLVARVRRDIEAGIYDTPEKMDTALSRLVERLA